LLELYTDGSCLSNPGGPGGWGVVVLSDGQVAEELAGSDPETTNNRMELTAAIRGLERVPAGTDVTLHSDSEYLINTMTRGWKRRRNNDLWAQLDRLVADRKVTWRWVQGHADNEMNILADRLAVEAAKSGTNPEPRGPLRPAPETGPEPKLTHVDETGRARMVDVGGKAVSDRVAVARGAVRMQPATLTLIREGGLEKGDVLSAARLAGVMAAKKTYELIPLCHQIPLNQVSVDFDTGESDVVKIESTARATWKTGVEMEALTAVAVAGLTIYDMCKAVDRGMRVEEIRVVRKSGGKSGDWVLEP